MLQCLARIESSALAAGGGFDTVFGHFEHIALFGQFVCQTRGKAFGIDVFHLDASAEIVDFVGIGNNIELLHFLFLRRAFIKGQYTINAIQKQGEIQLSGFSSDSLCSLCSFLIFSALHASAHISSCFSSVICFIVFSSIFISFISIA